MFSNCNCSKIFCFFKTRRIIYIKHEISTVNVQTLIFNKICFIQTDSTPEIIYSTQFSKTNIQFSAFRCIPVCCTKAYVNQILALQKAI